MATLLVQTDGISPNAKPLYVVDHINRLMW
jgi:hypothetical protein